jgi:hypothetical protein
MQAVKIESRVYFQKELVFVVFRMMRFIYDFRVGLKQKKSSNTQFRSVANACIGSKVSYWFSIRLMGM